MASKVKPLSRPLVELWLMVYSAPSFTLLGFLVLFVIQKPAFSQSHSIDHHARRLRWEVLLGPRSNGNDSYAA